MITERKTGDNKFEIIEILGTVEYVPERQYPWFANHNGVCQFFETKHEAVQFAAKGYQR